MCKESIEEDCMKMKVAEYNKKYKENNKEKISEYNKQYREKNKEYYRKYREVHREKDLKRKKLYRENNGDIIKAYREANKEKIKKYSSLYSKCNRDKYNINDQKRRARKALLPHSLTEEQWSKIKEIFHNKCAYCGEELPLTQEHFIPVSKGGEYTINNILPACKSCNSSKNDRDFFEWYPRQKYYSKKREKKIIEYLGYKDEKQQLAFVI